MKEIYTEIEIAAPPERVWAILTDFEQYPAWNPFIPSIEGEAREGARLRVRIRPPEARGMSFRPTVLEAVPGRTFRWQGHLFVPGLFDGEHAFHLEPRSPGRTRFVQQETFKGLLVPLFSGILGKSRRGFEAMNEALKARAETNGPAAADRA